MKLFKYTAIAFGTCALGFSSLAHAQEQEEVVVEEREPVGIGLTLGGGITNFTHQNSRDLVDIGGLWEVRAILGAGSPLSLEAAYVGTAQPMNFPEDATLLSNGLEGALRVNLGTGMAQPFVFGGMGWQRYSVEGTGRTVASISEDDVWTVPVGGGISFINDGFLFDIRGTYQFAFDDEVLQNAGELDEEAQLNTWSATARIGVVF